MITPLTIYRFGLCGNSANESIGKHSFRTKKHYKVNKVVKRLLPIASVLEAAVLRRLASIVVERRGLTTPPTPCFARAHHEKQLSTVFPSLTHHFDQKSAENEPFLTCFRLFFILLHKKSTHRFCNDEC